MQIGAPWLIHLEHALCDAMSLRAFSFREESPESLVASSRALLLVMGRNFRAGRNWSGCSLPIRLRREKPICWSWKFVTCMDGSLALALRHWISLSATLVIRPLPMITAITTYLIGVPAFHPAPHSSVVRQSRLRSSLCMQLLCLGSWHCELRRM